MEELEVLESIYLDDIKVNKDEGDSPVSIQLQLHPATGDELDKRYVCMTLTLNLPQQYPDEVPDIVITNPRGIAEEEVQSLLEELENLALERVGGEMLYELIEVAKESLTEGNVPYCPCTICCEHFTEEDMFTKTDCYHYFHNNCLQRYISHQLDVQEQEKKSHIQHTEINEDDKKIKCPVCREEISYDQDFLQDDFSNLTKDETFYQPSCDLRVWQKNMAELYLKQKEKGGIIDVEAEKNRYLLTDSDNEIPIIVSRVISDNTEKDQIKQPKVEKEDNIKRTSVTSKCHKTGRGQGRHDREPHFRGHRFRDRYDRTHSASDRPNQRRDYDYRPSSGRQQEYSKRDNDKRPISGSNYRRGFGRGSNSKSPRNDSLIKSKDFKDNRNENYNRNEKNGSVEEKLTKNDSDSPRNEVKVNDKKKKENDVINIIESSESTAEKKMGNAEKSDSTSDKGTREIKVVTKNESNLEENMTATDSRIFEKDKVPANSSKLPVSNTQTKDSSQIACDQVKYDRYRGRGQRKHAGEVNRGGMKSQGRFRDEYHHENSRWRDQDHYYGNRKYYDDYRDSKHYDRRGQGQNYDRKTQGYYDNRKSHEPKHRSENNRKTCEAKDPEKLSSSDSRSTESAKTKEPGKLSSTDSKSTESAKTKDVSNFDKSKTTQEQGAKSHDLNKKEKSRHIRKDVHREEKPEVPHRTSINNSKINSDRQEKQGCDIVTGSSTTKTYNRTSRPPGFEVKGPPPGFSEKSVKPPPGF